MFLFDQTKLIPRQGNHLHLLCRSLPLLNIITSTKKHLIGPNKCCVFHSTNHSSGMNNGIFLIYLFIYFLEMMDELCRVCLSWLLRTNVSVTIHSENAAKKMVLYWGVNHIVIQHRVDNVSFTHKTYMKWNQIFKNGLFSRNIGF